MPPLTPTKIEVFPKQLVAIQSLQLISSDTLILSKCQLTPICHFSYQKTEKTLWPLFYGWGSTALRLWNNYEEAVYFLPLSSQKLLVLDITRFIYSQQRFDCFLQSLSSSLIKCLQFQIFIQILINYT